MRNPSLRLHPIPASITAICPIAGRIDRYARADPLNSEIECPDPGLVDAAATLRGAPSSATGSSQTDWSEPIAANAVRIYSYDMVIHAGYLQRLLPSAVDEPSRAGVPTSSQPTEGGATDVRPPPTAAEGGILPKPLSSAPRAGYHQQPGRSDVRKELPPQRKRDRSDGWEGGSRGSSDKPRSEGSRDGWSRSEESRRRSSSNGHSDEPQRRREGRERSPRRSASASDSRRSELPRDQRHQNASSSHRSSSYDGSNRHHNSSRR